MGALTKQEGEVDSAVGVAGLEAKVVCLMDKRAIEDDNAVLAVWDADMACRTCFHKPLQPLLRTQPSAHSICIALYRPQTTVPDSVVPLGNRRQSNQQVAELCTQPIPQSLGRGWPRQVSPRS